MQGWVDPLGLTKRIYKHAPYHELTDNAVRRVGIDNANEEIVVLDRTREISDGVEEFHGHVREWDDLHPDQQKALKNAKKVNKRGKIIDQEGKIGSC